MASGWDSVTIPSPTSLSESDIRSERDIVPVSADSDEIVWLFDFPEAVDAFGWKSRKKIKERDNRTCQETGRKASDGWRLDAAHYDHTHGDGYDNPDNGRLLCVIEHLKEHEQIYQDTRGTNRESWARGALQALSNRIGSRGTHVSGTMSREDYEVWQEVQREHGV